MKKVILALSAAALVMGGTGCKKSAGYSFEEIALGDSISVAMGEFMGARFSENVKQQQLMNSNEPGLDLSSVVRGMEAVLYADTTDTSYLTGITIGMNLMNQIMQMKNAGIPANPEHILRSFKNVATMDSVNTQVYMNNFQTLNHKMTDMAQRRIMEQRAIEGEANGNAGKAYVDSIKAADSSVQTSESGLSYKIENPGEGEKVTREDKVMLNYVGKTIDGNVFDQTNGTPREMAAGNFIAGFSEGLMMLGKGGKATLYIPGGLAYGENGIPNIGIGPNATLVFDVEVVDIIPADKK